MQGRSTSAAQAAGVLLRLELKHLLGDVLVDDAARTAELDRYRRARRLGIGAHDHLGKGRTLG